MCFVTKVKMKIFGAFCNSATLKHQAIRHVSHHSSSGYKSQYAGTQAFGRYIENKTAIKDQR